MKHVMSSAIFGQFEPCISGGYPHSSICAAMWSVLKKPKRWSTEEAAAGINERSTFIPYTHKVSQGLEKAEQRHGI